MPYFHTRQRCLVYCNTVILLGLSQINDWLGEIRNTECIGRSEVRIKTDADSKVVKIIDAGPFGMSLFVMNFIKVIHCFLS